MNGVSSLVDIENSFNKLRIPELDLPITQESTIKSALTELYKLQEDLQIHLQGGPLADPSTMGAQRRKKVADLLERVMKEAALYEEFVNKGNDLILFTMICIFILNNNELFGSILAQHLSLDRILNESEGSSDDECIDSETIDTESEIPGFEVFVVIISFLSTFKKWPYLINGPYRIHYRIYLAGLQLPHQQLHFRHVL